MKKKKKVYGVSTLIKLHFDFHFFPVTIISYIEGKL